MKTTLRPILENPEYSAAWSLLQRLQSKRDELDREASELCSLIATNTAGVDMARGERAPAPPPPGPDPVSVAERLLAGEGLPPDSGTVAAARTRFDEVQREQRAIVKAIEEQRRRVEEVNIRVSKQTADSVAADYKRLARGLADAMLRLAEAEDTLVEYRRQWSAAGYRDHHLPRHFLPGITTVRGSVFHRVLDSLAEEGLIARGDFPAPVETIEDATRVFTSFNVGQSRPDPLVPESFAARGARKVAN